jgi:RsiW-degrading membrane proteinase PrsW (M82 family)
MGTRPGEPSRTNDPEAPAKSQLIPLSSPQEQFASKINFIPFIVLFFAIFLVDNSTLWLVALALAGGAYAAVYYLCGKAKPIWLPMVPASITFLLLRPEIWPIFDSVFGVFLGKNRLPPQETWPSIPLTKLFYEMFFFVGLKEEFVKALPVVFLAFVLPRINLPKIKNSVLRPLEIHEPLDGILIATGSALGFTLYETMLGYLPRALHSGSFMDSIDLLVHRIGGDFAGHIAYSGFLGYFVGLAMMRPKNRWVTIGIGWLCAATLHTLWDSVDSLPILIGVGIISYGFLGAAILKARQISPSRKENFPTRLDHVGEIPPPSPPAPPATYTSVPAPQAFTFFVAGQRLLLTPGRRLVESEMPGLQAAAGDGVVAEVTRHPADPNILGFKNLSTASWTASTSAGESREVPSGKTFRLVSGTSVQFAGIRGEIWK